MKETRQRTKRSQKKKTTSSEMDITELDDDVDVYESFVVKATITKRQSVD